MYRLEYSKSFSLIRYDLYYICNEEGKISDVENLYPYVAVNHDLKEIIFYQLFEDERNYKLYDQLFRLVEDTLMNIYEDYEVNLIRTQCNMIYHAWKQNERKF